MSPQSQLYLRFDVGGDGAEASAALEAALAAAPVACVLLYRGDAAALEPGLAKALIGIAQKRDVAALVADDAGLARMLKADGVHVSWSKAPLDAYKAARETLGARALIGVDAGRSRHDAMELGEAGADYVAFGIPAHVEDRETAAARQIDLVSWWCEIFEVPVVAFDVADDASAEALAAAGADFITIDVAASMAIDEISERVRQGAVIAGEAGVAA